MYEPLKNIEHSETHEAETAAGMLEDFPPLNVPECEAAVNALFPAYLFLKPERDRVEYWTSCCRRHGVMDNPPRIVTNREAVILYGKHNMAESCPFCGRAVTVKRTCKLGKRKSIERYEPVLILSAKDGALYARAYWTLKDYTGELTAAPRFSRVAAYRFEPGRAVQIDRGWSGKLRASVATCGRDITASRAVSDPFLRGNIGGYSYESYTVINIGAVSESFARYCQYEEFRAAIYETYTDPNAKHKTLCRFFAAAAIYPRQVEMLMKAGLKSLVVDIVERRKKNRDVLNWEAASPAEAFNLSKPEMRAWMKSGADLETVAAYKKLRKRGLGESFEILSAARESLDPYQFKPFIAACVKHGLKPGRVCRYLSDYVPGCARGRGGETMTAPWEAWKDWLHMAAELGFDMKNETVLLPHDLYGHHDDAAAQIRMKHEREYREEIEPKKKEAQERMEKRRKKYNVSAGGYFIRVAESAEEIVREGKALQHCVAGYAERHMAGVLTILFLRREETPDASLYTIEMDGNRLAQIHGYKNEFRYCPGHKQLPDPRETMAWLLDPWLAWLKKGSPKNKDGDPAFKAEPVEIMEVKSA